MLEMINRSLDLFKMENGRYDFRPEPVDILSVMRQVLAELMPSLAAKALKINLCIDGRYPGEGQKVMAMAERFLCHSMFANLCRNAVEASPPDEVITITFEQRNDVTTGMENVGEVPRTIRENFFEKFVTAGKRNGSGLGTYSARLMAQTQRGSISLDTSALGRTGVRITLPSGEKNECAQC